MKNRFVKDNGLTMRMGWTIFLNGLIYVVLILAIWWIVGQNLGGVIVAVLISAGAFFFQWYFSDKIAMRAMGGREVSPRRLRSCIRSSTDSASWPIRRNPAWPSRTLRSPMPSPPAAPPSARWCA